jgi:hypothetical protein
MVVMTGGMGLLRKIAGMRRMMDDVESVVK